MKHWQIIATMLLVNTTGYRTSLEIIGALFRARKPGAIKKREIRRLPSNCHIDSKLWPKRVPRLR
jgi:hypothetical protein